MTTIGAAARRMTRSLVLQHLGGSISSLKVPWRAHEYAEDLPIPGHLFTDRNGTENFLAMNKGVEMWNASLSPRKIGTRFQTEDLPLPSSFSQDQNEYFMKLLLYRNLDYGWYTVYKKKEKVDRYVSKGSVKFSVEPLITGHVKEPRPYTVHDFEYFSGTIGSDFAASLIPCSSDYEVEKTMIGKGSQGEAFKGIDVFTRRTILMKKLTYPCLLGNGEAREVFFSKNVNRPSVRDFQCSWVDDEGITWIVLDYVDSTLHDYIDGNTQFNMLERLSIFIQIGDAADGLIDDGILDIDLEPGNVLLEEGVDACIADLGTCGILEGGKCKPLEFQSWLPQYAAPELLLKKDYNDKNDCKSVFT